MHFASRGWLAAALISLAAIAHAGEPSPATPKIDQPALLKRIQSQDPSTVILDVRTPEEFAKGHIPGAINIPHTHLPSRIAEIADAGEKDIVVYCATGVRSEQAADRLRDHGFTRLLHLDGDMTAWEEKQRPITK